MGEAFKSLELANVRIEREGKNLLGSLDLKLETSGITAILGHNGSGKSLFIRACHGQFALTSGNVLWNGRLAAQSRRNRSLVFQNTPILRRSVKANVEFALVAHGVKRQERAGLLQTVLHNSRLESLIHSPAASLSGGEKQRMALARAMVTNPQVILLDEPSASLDPASTKELEAMVKQISASGVKILIATHDLAQARRLADDVIVFGNGKVLAQEAATGFFERDHEGEVADYLEGRL